MLTMVLKREREKIKRRGGGEEVKRRLGEGER